MKYILIIILAFNVKIFAQDNKRTSSMNNNFALKKEKSSNNDSLIQKPILSFEKSKGVIGYTLVPVNRKNSNDKKESYSMYKYTK
jgi:hypothetical protein